MKWNQALAVTASMLLLTAVSLCQQQSTKVAQPVTKTFSVNGKPVQTSLVQVDNPLYVALDDLASNLDGSLTTKATSVDLAVPINNNQNTSSSNAASGAGAVKGVFTYCFKANYGSRPDVGAKVWIVKGRGIHIPETAHVFSLGSELVLLDADKQQTTLGPIVAQAIADGSGSATLPNIPAGVYTAVMKSSHAQGGTVNQLNRRDLTGRVKTSTINISAGQVADISTDFGISTF